MFSHSQKIFAALILVVTFSTSAARAANEGQEELDKATEAKLSTTTLIDLGEVIRLTESALQKGLDESNTEFANKLLASTLVQRATTVAGTIFKSSPPDQRWPQFRQFALSDLEKSIKLDAKQPQALILIAQLNLLPEGDGKRAKEAANQAVEYSADDPQICAKALVLRSGMEEKLENRLPDLNEAVRLAPNDADTILSRGSVLADLEKYEEALADLNKAIELNSENAKTYFVKSIVLTRMKKYDESLAALDQALKLVPNAVDLWLQKTSIHSLQKKFDEAIEDLSKAVSLDPSNAKLLVLRSKLYLEKGAKEKALADAQRAVQLSPKYIEAVLQLGMVYTTQKRLSKAIEIYSEFLKEHPEESGILRTRAETYLTVGKHAEAVADFEKAYKDLSKDPLFLNNFAWVLATSPDEKLRDGKRALKMAAEACELTEYKQAHILSTLAAAYAETGDFDNALKLSTKATEIGSEEHDEELKKELESYKLNKPWREVLSENESEETENKSAGPEEKPAEPAEKPSVPEDKSAKPKEPAAEIIEPFNGKNLEGWTLKQPRDRSKWTAGAAQVDPQNPAGLIVSFPGQQPGDLVNLEPNGVDIHSVSKFGDCSIELEFMIPKDSNSGVYVMGEYEVQIADSFGKKEIGQSDLGAIFEAAAPKVNAAKAPGQWQTLVIDFQAPRFEGGAKTANARFVKVTLNGQVIQENIEMKSQTPGGLSGKEVPEGPLMFQGNHGPAAFRNIKISLHGTPEK